MLRRAGVARQFIQGALTYLNIWILKRGSQIFDIEISRSGNRYRSRSERCGSEVQENEHPERRYGLPPPPPGAQSGSRPTSVHCFITKIWMSPVPITTSPLFACVLKESGSPGGGLPKPALGT